MSMLAFFPWLKIKEDIKIGDIKLHKFKLSEENTNKDRFQITCEKVVKHYYIHTNHIIDECTMLSINKKDIFNDFNEEELDFLFSFSEILAFSGLSKREYFGFGFNYWNKDNFTLVIQGFDEKSDGVTIVTKRRDGSTKAYWDGDAFKVNMPFHVNNIVVTIDITLAKSLLDFQESLGANGIFLTDALFFFNRANTDDNLISEYQEIVMLVSAFQRLLDCKTGKEDELINRFMTIYNPKQDFNVNHSKRIKNSKYINISMPLREAWLRDFYQLRNDYAHGKRISERPRIWIPQEHLLLGAYSFPLLVKILLSKKYYYLSEDDADDIELFEQLIEINILKKPKDSEKWEWDKIRSDYKFHKAVERAVKKAIKNEDSDN
jgi:hypothetical protein